MGRSGTTSLWSSGLTGSWLAFVGEQVRRIRRVWGCHYRTANQRHLIARSFGFEDWHNLGLEPTLILDQSYRVKPHEQLVLVSLTHYCASTPSLSTSWSRTTLQGAQGPGKTYLETSFPLRCFQRLSLPHIATRQCHWRDNRYTRGASTPVLSY